jgi:hypothetical protein
MAGLLDLIRDRTLYRRAMGDFPNGAAWSHVPPLMTRAAVSGIGSAMRNAGLPFDVAVDVEPSTKKQIRRLFVIQGADVTTIRLRLFDNAILIGTGRTIYLRGENACNDLVQALLDAIEASFVPKVTRPRGRPRKVPLTTATRPPRENNFHHRR